MKTLLLENENIIRQGPANLQRGIETVGGRLYLTNLRLIFESHLFNIQLGSTIIELSRIIEVSNCWTKFLGIIPLADNSLSVKTVEGRDYRFVLWNREQWTLAIKKRISDLPR